MAKDPEEETEEQPKETKKGSARTGSFWFTETEKAYNYRIGRLVVGIFAAYLTITAMGVICASMSYYYYGERPFIPFLMGFVVCLCSYVPFLILYFRFLRVARVDFYSKGVMVETFLGGERFLPYRRFTALEEKKVKNVGKAYELVPERRYPMRINILVSKNVEGVEEYASQIKRAVERGR
jgi:hypothetical protein